MNPLFQGFGQHFRPGRDCGGPRSGRHGLRHLLAAGLMGEAGMPGLGGRGFRASRMFGAGDLQLIVLALLADKPRHGYEIMKALEEHSSGFYAPSPGMIYPALTYLEEVGFATVEAEANKKLYRINEAGQAFLHEHRDFTDDIFDRVREMAGGFASGAMGDLNSAFARLAGQAYRGAWNLGPEHPAVARIAEALRKAAEEIENITKASPAR